MSADRPYRPYVAWRDPMILTMLGVCAAIVFSLLGGLAWLSGILHHRQAQVTPAPLGATVPTDCRALRDQARVFTQAAVSGKGDTTSRALVALAELQLWQAEGCRP